MNKFIIYTYKYILFLIEDELFFLDYIAYYTILMIECIRKFNKINNDCIIMTRLLRLLYAYHFS